MKSDFGIYIRTINNQVNGFISSQVKQYGIRQGQMDYFLMISMKPGINQLELSNMKNVGKAAVTKALKVLEDEGLVKRVVDEEDRRNIKCYVTEKGAGIVDELNLVKEKAEKTLFEGFSDEELEAFGVYLRRLVENSGKLVDSRKDN